MSEREDLKKKLLAKYEHLVDTMLENLPSSETLRLSDLERATGDLGAKLMQEILQSLLLAMTSDPDGEVRKNTAITLGELGDPQAIPVLLPLLLNDKTREIRMHAAIALGQLGDASGLDMIRDYIAFGHKAYGWGYLHYVLEAVKTLRASVRPQLIKMVERLPAQHFLQDTTQILIAEIFAEQGDIAALPALKRLLESDHDTVQAAAQQAIARIRTAQVGDNR